MATYTGGEWDRPRYSMPAPVGASGITFRIPGNRGFERGSVPAEYSRASNFGGGGYGSYGGMQNPFAGMGYNGPIGGMNAPLYGGESTPINIGQVGGYIMAPGAQEARYRQAYAQAQAANQARYNELAGNSIGLATGVQDGRRMVQVGGKWVPQSGANVEQVNRELAQQSNFAPALGGYAGRYYRGMTGTEALMDDVGGRYADRTRRGMANVDAMDSLAGDYDERYKRNMGYVDQLGVQERRDIDERYDKAKSSAAADLAARGFSNSSVLPNVRASVERDRDAALGRLNDRLAQTRINNDASLSGDTLRFREGQGDRRLRTDAALSGDEAQFWDQARRYGIGLDSDLSGDLLRMIENVQDPYPDPAIRMRMQGF
jgi:hypothetical protein